MLLKTLQHTQIPPTVDNYPAENVNNAEMEKFCSRAQNRTRCYRKTGLGVNFKRSFQHLTYPSRKQAMYKTKFPITLNIQIQAG